MKVTIRKAKDGFRWRAVSRNGRIVAESGESYRRRIDCVKAWARMARDAAGAEIVV